jgi:hypothetical protein
MTFEAWMKAADRIVEQIAGVSIHDLPDIDFRGLYDSDADPEEAAEAALEYAGFEL